MDLKYIGDFMRSHGCSNNTMPVSISLISRLTIPLKIHKNENVFGFDFDFCTNSLLVMRKS
jgi:hypothetical protein